jgi:hypothetical protein
MIHINKETTLWMLLLYNFAGLITLPLLQFYSPYSNPFQIISAILLLEVLSLMLSIMFGMINYDVSKSRYLDDD